MCSPLKNQLLNSPRLSSCIESSLDDDPLVPIKSVPDGFLLQAKNHFKNSNFVSEATERVGVIRREYTELIQKKQNQIQYHTEILINTYLTILENFQNVYDEVYFIQKTYQRDLEQIQEEKDRKERVSLQNSTTPSDLNNQPKYSPQDIERHNIISLVTNISKERRNSKGNTEKDQQVLKTLNLSWKVNNNSRFKISTKIIMARERYHILDKLILNYNSISLSSVMLLSLFLSYSPRLSYLSLVGNSLSDICFKHLSNSLFYNKNLKTLILSENLLTSTSLYYLSIPLQTTNSTLSNLYIHINQFNKSENVRTQFPSQEPDPLPVSCLLPPSESGFQSWFFQVIFGMYQTLPENNECPQNENEKDKEIKGNFESFGKCLQVNSSLEFLSIWDSGIEKQRKKYLESCISQNVSRSHTLSVFWKYTKGWVEYPPSII